MEYATNFALVDKTSNKVTNIIWGLIYNMEDFENEKFYPVQCDNLSVTIGDSYINGQFFRADGKKIVDKDEQINELGNALIILGVQPE